jgi:hypothetical protein
MTPQNICPSTAAKLIRTVLAICGDGSELVRAHEREWASATFSGARHNLELLVPVEDKAAPLPAAIAALPDHDFELAGEIVADCAITFGQRSRTADGRILLALRVELLTIVAD